MDIVGRISVFPHINAHMVKAQVKIGTMDKDQVAWPNLVKVRRNFVATIFFTVLVLGPDHFIALVFFHVHIIRAWNLDAEFLVGRVDISTAVDASWVS